MRAAKHIRMCDMWIFRKGMSANEHALNIFPPLPLPASPRLSFYVSPCFLYLLSMYFSGIPLVFCYIYICVCVCLGVHAVIECK